MLELRAFADVCLQLAGTAHESPPWPWLLGQLVDRAQGALVAHLEPFGGVRGAAAPTSAERPSI